jgi:glycosyltransferase involved in cell wall biosynthesis
MKICMLAYTFYESDNRLRRYSEKLVQGGDHVDAIVLRREGQEAYECIKGVHVHRIQKRVKSEKTPFSYLVKLLVFFFRSAWAVTNRHIREPYDVIHVHSVPDFEVFATLIPRLMGARIILDIHDLVPELYAGKFAISQKSILFRTLVLLERLSTRYAHHTIIANHIWYERLIQRSVKAEHCTAILNYPDTSIFYRRPRPVEASDDFVMFYPGSLSWHQGVDLIISAMTLLRDKLPNLKFLIFGDGNQREELVAQAQAAGLSDRILIKDWQRSEELASTMAMIDLGVEPKRKRSFANEALSTKILEFMVMGVPVLASDTLVHKRYFKDGVVEYFESENVEDLASNIFTLATDPAKREVLRARGTQFIQTNTWDVKHVEYLDLLDKLVARPSKERAELRSVAPDATVTIPTDQCR